MSLKSMFQISEYEASEFPDYLFEDEESPGSSSYIDCNSINNEASELTGLA